METKISLTGIHFRAHHGVLEQERRVGGDYEVSLEVCYPFENAMESDSLEDTLNYAELYAVVEHEMQQPSRLLEHVVGRIVRAVMNRFPEVTSGTVILTKLHPPFKCDMPCGGASVTVSF